MNVVEWAVSVKPDLVQMQSTQGIPALWAAAQMCHESANDGGASLSSLALDAQGRKMTDGWLEGEFTVVRLRPLLEALGPNVVWDESTQAVTVSPRGGPVA